MTAPPPPPPPYLKVFQSKFLAPSQFLYLGQSILSAQLVNVHFVCATLITPVCLFFVEQERISRHLYLGLFVMFVLFLILWPNSTDLLSRRGLAERWDCWNCNLEVSTFSFFQLLTGTSQNYKSDLSSFLPSSFASLLLELPNLKQTGFVWNVWDNILSAMSLEWTRIG